MITKNQLAAIGAWWLGVVTAWATKAGLIMTSAGFALCLVLTAVGCGLFHPAAEDVLRDAFARLRVMAAEALDEVFPPFEEEEDER